MKRIKKETMRRVGCMLLVILMLFTVVPGAALAVMTTSESGVPETGEVPLAASEVLPGQYGISTPDELEAFLLGERGPNDGHFVVTDDIDMSGRGPFQGRGLVGGVMFTGTFDGGGHNITGLRLRPREHGVTGNANNDNSIGFIRVAGPGALIQNFRLTGAGAAAPAFLDDVTAWDGVQSRSGLLIGRVASGTVTIQNVHLDGHTVLRMNRASTNDNNVIGGFVGGVEAGATLNITDISAANLELHSQAGRTGSMGGVIGITNGTVHIRTSTQGTNQINVNIRGATATVPNTITTTDAANPTRAGGVIGSVAAGHTSISDVTVAPATPAGLPIANQQIRARVAAGGVVGWTGTGGSLTIIDTVNEGRSDDGQRITAFMGSSRIGGIVGHARNSTRLVDVQNDAVIENVAGGNAHVGGVVGASEAALTVTGAVNNGRVISNNATARTGGIVGRAARATTLTDVRNTAEVRHGTTVATPVNVGGIVGRSENRLVITDALNTGNVVRTGVTGGNCHLGGIVGHIRLARRQNADLTNVTNTGHINPGGISASASNTVSARAGGIVGNTQRAANASVRITGASNWGDVRAALAAGGIIGRDDAANTVITRALNHGFVHTTQTQRRAGGIVGDANRAGLIVRESGNNGEVAGLATATTSDARAGFGGIIGRSSQSHRVERSFNAGVVRIIGAGHNPRVGGIVGQNRRNLLVQDSYNIGDVNGTGTGADSARRNRGSGIVGERINGTITIERVFVAGNFNGVTVAQSSTRGPNGSVAGIRFNQVYVDQTASRVAPAPGGSGGQPITSLAVRMQGGRAGVTLVDTELLTSGFLPGLNRGPWMYGIYNIDGDLQRTYPFLSWQTEGRLEPQFFGGDLEEDPAFANRGILPALDSTNPATASRTVNFTDVRLIDSVRPAPGTVAGTHIMRGIRTFNPYVQGNHAFRAEGNSNISVNVGANNPMSIGLISPNGVVGFAMDEAPERFRVIAVDEANPENAFQIDHAIITSSIPALPPGFSMPGLFMGNLEAVREMLDGDGTAAITVQAVGYADYTRTLTAADLEELEETREIRIPMTRVPLNIRVWVRSSPDGADGDTMFTGLENQWILSNGRLTHTNHLNVSNDIPRVTTGTLATTLHSFLLEGAYIHGTLEGNAPRMSIETVLIDPVTTFRRDANGNIINIGTAENPVYVIDIFLEDIRLPVVPDVILYSFTGFNDDGEPVGTPLLIGGGTGAGVVAARFNLHTMDPTATITTTRVNANGGGSTAGNPRTFRVGSAANPPTMLTSFWIEPIGAFASQYLPSDVLYFADEMDEDDDGNPLAIVRVFMIPIGLTEVHVAEAIFTGIDEATGEPQFDYVLIPGAALRLEGEALAGAGGVFGGITAGTGSEFTAEASGFETLEYLVTSASRRNDGVLTIVMERLPIVTFELSGGSLLSEMSLMGTVPRGDSPVNIPVHGVDFAREGYEFLGWSMNDPEGPILSHTQVADGPITGATTFYAHWERIEYDVTFDLNGGALVGADDSILTERTAHGDSPANVPVYDTDFARAGHSFLGWSRTADGSVIEDMADEVILADTTFYARWERNRYTVTYHLRGGNIGGNTTNPTEEVYFEAYPANVPDGTALVLAGHTFQWWSETPNGTEVNPTTVAITGPTTFYAVWDPNIYGVTYDLQGGNIGGDTENPTEYVAFGGNPAQVPTGVARDGHTFLGWSRTADGAVITDMASEIISDETVFYARWSANTINVTFHRNDGSETPATALATVTFGADYEDAMAESAVAALTENRIGFTFVGWYTAPADGNRVHSETEMTNPEAHTLYARWSANTINVTFNRNDGSETPATASATVIFGADYEDAMAESAVAALTENRPGFTFAGWYTMPAGGNRVYPGTEVTNHEAHVLYARWTGNSVTVTFDRNDAGTASDTETQTVIFGGDYADAMAHPAVTALEDRTGYTFQGWYTRRVGGARVTPLADVISYEAHTLYARWTTNAVMITFDRNDIGVGSETAQAIPNFGETYEAAMNTATVRALEERTGWTFAGWFTERTGGERVYPESYITNPEAHTLYARWERNRYTVTYHLRGGSIGGNATNPTEEVYFEAYPANVPDGTTLVLAGHTFQWWSETPNGTEVNPTTAAITGPTTFYAVWDPNVYCVTYDLQGGNIGGDTENPTEYVIFNGNPTQVPTGVARDGHTFLGWSMDDPDGPILSRTDVEAVAIEDETVFYARWEINEYTVTYDLNQGSLLGGDISILTETVTFEDSPANVPVYDVDFERDGYTFLGWSRDSADGAILSRSDVEAAIILGNTTFYARWELNEYTVTYDLNQGELIGADTSILTETVTRGDSPANVPVYGVDFERDGYTFLGWSGTADGSVIADMVSEVILGNTTFYARWVLNEYTVTYNLNQGNLLGDDASILTETVTRGESPANVPVYGVDFAREGHTFLGWSQDSADGAILSRSDVEAAIILGNTAFYARWALNEYTVTYGLNQGELLGEDAAVLKETVVRGDSPARVPVYGADFVREGYTFLGWSQDSTGGAILSGSDVEAAIILGDTTFYARWELNTYIVTYDLNLGELLGDVSILTETVTRGDGPINVPVYDLDFTRAGYTFLGWSQDGTGGAILSGSDVEAAIILGDTTFYARWELNEYEVIFFRNYAGANEPHHVAERVPHNTSVAVPTAPTRAGYNFVGWFTETEPAEGAEQFDFGTSVTGDLLLYAQWQPREIMVFFVGNGGTPDVQRAMVVEGSDYQAMLDLVGNGVALPEREGGFEFLHWSTSAAPGSSPVDPELPITSRFLFAIWSAPEEPVEPDTVRVHFVGSNGLAPFTTVTFAVYPDDAAPTLAEA
ncbi:MAG: InlB B-repeat-containing protein, partial [Oscillospiraceae bacterium]|nr:InlB B-repeat-containing protein [Oscillospiraceae bacterium]